MNVTSWGLVDTNSGVFLINPATLARGQATMEILSTSLNGVNVGDPYGNLYYPQGYVSLTFSNQPSLCIGNYSPLFTSGGSVSFTLDAIAPYLNGNVSLEVLDDQSNVLSQSTTTLSNGTGSISWDGTSNSVAYNCAGHLVYFQLTATTGTSLQAQMFKPNTSGGSSSSSETFFMAGINSAPALAETLFAAEELDPSLTSYIQQYIGGMAYLDDYNNSYGAFGGNRDAYNYSLYANGYLDITQGNQLGSWSSVDSALSNRTQVTGLVFNGHGSGGSIGFNPGAGWTSGLTAGQLSAALGGNINITVNQNGANNTVTIPANPLPVVFLAACNAAPLSSPFGTLPYATLGGPSSVFLGFSGIVNTTNNIYQFAGDFWNYFAGDALGGNPSQSFESSFNQAVADYLLIRDAEPQDYGNGNMYYNSPNN